MTTRKWLFAKLLLAACCGNAAAQSVTPVPAPFESFALNGNASVTWSQQLDAIKSADGMADIRVLIIESTADPRERMRGLRFDFRSNAAVDKVYVDESEFATLLRDLEWMEQYADEMHEQGSPPTRVQGTERCWMPETPARILCPSYVVSPHWSGLSLGAYTGPGFNFPDRRPAELIAVVRHAIETLASR